MVYTVEPLHNSHLGDRKKCLFLSVEEGLNKSQCMDCPSRNWLAVAREVAVVERWSLMEV